jgi:hypothetical protein
LLECAEKEEGQATLKGLFLGELGVQFHKDFLSKAKAPFLTRRNSDPT